MVETVRLNRAGGPEVIELVEHDVSPPGEGEVWLQHEAIGVNYLDSMQRSGAVAIQLPSGLGLEAAGRVVAVGSGVTSVTVGDRVAYALGPIGSYASGRLYPAERLVRLPDAVSTSEAAAILFKGLTAQYLIKATYRVTSETIVLLYGAAGGVGQILASWATHLGAEVIGVVSRPESAAAARAAGCRHVLVWSENLAAQVGQVTRGEMVDVVYDGVGRKTFDASIASLRPRGMMVSIGASSGLPEPVPIPLLNSKSLFLTRPSLAGHAGNVDEYQGRATDVLDAVARGFIRPSIARRFALHDATAAHLLLDAGGAGGTILLEP